MYHNMLKKCIPYQLQCFSKKNKQGKKYFELFIHKVAPGSILSNIKYCVKEIVEYSVIYIFSYQHNDFFMYI